MNSGKKINIITNALLFIFFIIFPTYFLFVHASNNRVGGNIVINILYALLMLVISYYILAILYSLMHFIMAKIKKEEIIAIVISPFAIVFSQDSNKKHEKKDNEDIDSEITNNIKTKSIEFKLLPRYYKLLGGAVITKLDLPEQDKDVEDIVTQLTEGKFKEPAGNTIIFVFLCIVLYATFTFVMSINILFYAYIPLLYLVMFSLFNLFFSTFENNRDFKVAEIRKQMLDDKSFATKMIFVNSSYNEKFKQRKKNYMLKNIAKELDTQKDNESYVPQFEDLMIIDLVMNKYLIKEIKRMNVGFDKYIMYLFDHFEEYCTEDTEHIINKNDFLIIYHHIVLYLMQRKRLKEANELYGKIIKIGYIKNREIFEYLENRAETLLEYKDYNLYLSDMNNIVYNGIDGIGFLFANYKDTELMINERLKDIKLTSLIKTDEYQEVKEIVANKAVPEKKSNAALLRVLNSIKAKKENIDKEAIIDEDEVVIAKEETLVTETTEEVIFIESDIVLSADEDMKDEDGSTEDAEIVTEKANTVEEQEKVIELEDIKVKEPEDKKKSKDNEESTKDTIKHAEKIVIDEITDIEEPKLAEKIENNKNDNENLELGYDTQEEVKESEELKNDDTDAGGKAQDSKDMSLDAMTEEISVETSEEVEAKEIEKKVKNKINKSSDKNLNNKKKATRKKKAKKNSGKKKNKKSESKKKK